MPKSKKIVGLGAAELKALPPPAQPTKDQKRLSSFNKKAKSPMEDKMDDDVMAFERKAEKGRRRIRDILYGKYMTHNTKVGTAQTEDIIHRYGKSQTRRRRMTPLAITPAMKERYDSKRSYNDGYEGYDDKVKQLLKSYQSSFDADGGWGDWDSSIKRKPTNEDAVNEINSRMVGGEIRDIFDRTDDYRGPESWNGIDQDYVMENSERKSRFNELLKSNPHLKTSFDAVQKEMSKINDQNQRLFDEAPVFWRGGSERELEGMLTSRKIKSRKGSYPFTATSMNKMTADHFKEGSASSDVMDKGYAPFVMQLYASPFRNEGAAHLVKYTGEPTPLGKRTEKIEDDYNSDHADQMEVRIKNGTSILNPDKSPRIRRLHFQVPNKRMGEGLREKYKNMATYVTYDANEKYLGGDSEVFNKRFRKFFPRGLGSSGVMTWAQYFQLTHNNFGLGAAGSEEEEEAGAKIAAIIATLYPQMNKDQQAKAKILISRITKRPDKQVLRDIAKFLARFGASNPAISKKIEALFKNINKQPIAVAVEQSPKTPEKTQEKADEKLDGFVTKMMAFLTASGLIISAKESRKIRLKEARSNKKGIPKSGDKEIPTTAGGIPKRKKQREILAILTTKHDPRVDDVCIPFHGLPFKLGDPLRPKLPLHYGCRCTWIDKETGEDLGQL